MENISIWKTFSIWFATFEYFYVLKQATYTSNASEKICLYMEVPYLFLVDTALYSRY